PLTAFARVLKACLYSLADDLSLELRESSGDVEHGAAHRRRRIHRLVERYELDPECPELVQSSRQVRDAPRETIEPENRDRVEASPPCVGHEPIECRATLLRAGDPLVDILPRDLPISASTIARLRWRTFPMSMATGPVIVPNCAA